MSIDEYIEEILENWQETCSDTCTDPNTKYLQKAIISHNIALARFVKEISDKLENHIQSSNPKNTKSAYNLNK